METCVDAFKAIRTLVVDDESLLADRHAAILDKTRRAQCRPAYTFDKAILLFKEMQPEIVIADVRLLRDGNKDGFTLVRAMRVIADTNNWPQPFCIFITGYEVEEARRRVQAIPGSVLLEKPVSDYELLEVFADTVSRLPVWQSEAERRRQIAISWPEDLEEERIRLIDEGFSLRKSNGALGDEKAQRLEILQEAHASWLRQQDPLDTARVEAALREIRRLPLSNQ